jgi:hypothetical protein
MSDDEIYSETLDTTLGKILLEAHEGKGDFPVKIHVILPLSKPYASREQALNDRHLLHIKACRSGFFHAILPATDGAYLKSRGEITDIRFEVNPQFVEGMCDGAGGGDKSAVMQINLIANLLKNIPGLPDMGPPSQGRLRT